jgi:hypothetical protein
MIVSISVELSPPTRKCQCYCSADLSSPDGSWNFRNGNYNPRPEGGILSKPKLIPRAGGRNVPIMNGILRPGAEHFSLADCIESSAPNRILSITVELCLPTGKFQASATEMSILRLEVESFPRRIAFSDSKLRMSQSNIIQSSCTRV